MTRYINKVNESGASARPLRPLTEKEWQVIRKLAAGYESPTVEATKQLSN